MSKKGARFDALVRPHVTVLYKSAHRFVGNADDAEDLVQDVLTKLYPRTDEMGAIADLRPWLLRVLYNEFIDGTRRRSRSPITVSDDEAAARADDPVNTPERGAVNGESSRRLDAALGQLKEDQRALITLHLVQGFTLEELTKVMDAPIGTLKAKLHRTKAQLRKVLLDATFTPE